MAITSALCSPPPRWPSRCRRPPRSPAMSINYPERFSINQPARQHRAILMLLTVYGLRAGEVAHLHLEDFDWEEELLLVTRSKTQRARTYPLSHTVGEAVL